MHRIDELHFARWSTRASRAAPSLAGSVWCSNTNAARARNSCFHFKSGWREPSSHRLHYFGLVRRRNQKTLTLPRPKALQEFGFEHVFPQVRLRRSPLIAASQQHELHDLQ